MSTKVEAAKVRMDNAQAAYETFYSYASALQGSEARAARATVLRLEIEANASRAEYMAESLESHGGATERASTVRRVARFVRMLAMEGATLGGPTARVRLADLAVTADRALAALSVSKDEGENEEYFLSLIGQAWHTYLTANHAEVARHYGHTRPVDVTLDPRLDG
jgi:hypothetical protein